MVRLLPVWGMIVRPPLTVKKVFLLAVAVAEKMLHSRVPAPVSVPEEVAVPLPVAAVVSVNWVSTRGFGESMVSVGLALEVPGGPKGVHVIVDQLVGPVMAYVYVPAWAGTALPSATASTTKVVVQGNRVSAVFIIDLKREKGSTGSRAAALLYFYGPSPEMSWSDPHNLLLC
jgi:hypothetical protein